MSDENKPQESALAIRENKELEEWLKSRGAPLPAALAFKMYELYLNGYTCEEIYRVNGGKFPLGQIAEAKQVYEWDKMKERQLQSMYSNIHERITKTKNDAIVHTADLIAAFHKRWGDKLKQFIQSGDPELVEGLELGSIRNYKEVLTMLQALTAKEDKKVDKTVKVEGTVTHVHEQGVKGQITSKKSLDLLDALDSEAIEAKKDE